MRFASTLLVCAGVLLPAVLWMGAADGLRLVITPTEGGDAIFAAPLEPGERFTLRYTHSVDGTPIWEEHSADGEGNLYVEEERFVMIGAGMGDLPGRGRWTARGRLQAIEGLHVRVDPFILRVGSPGVDHTILWRGTSTNLSALVPGESVRVSAHPVTRLARWWRAWVER